MSPGVYDHVALCPQRLFTAFLHPSLRTVCPLHISPLQTRAQGTRWSLAYPSQVPHHLSPLQGYLHCPAQGPERLWVLYLFFFNKMHFTFSFLK